MSDYHPDGGQLFFPENEIDFMMCLGKKKQKKPKRLKFNPYFVHPAWKTSGGLRNEYFFTLNKRMLSKIKN